METLLMGVSSDLRGVLLLGDYNTRVVVLGTTLLGISAGVVGVFLLLRKRSLMGDALSHATLPGIALAFLMAMALGASGKSLPVLLVGAAVTAVLGVGCVMLIRSQTRLKEDAAMGIVLSVFFALGAVLLGIVQQLPGAGAAGLESFIYGRPASMLASDAKLMGVVAACVVLVSTLLMKELTLLCFDSEFAASRGYPVTLLDTILMAMVVVVTVIGLQAVGLILVLALLIIPAAAARFWTDRLPTMLLIAATLGAFSGWLGTILSALWAYLPAGAIIVLVATGLFSISLLVGRKRGVILRAVQHRALSRRIAMQHLLRAVYEWQETHEQPLVPQSALLEARSWSRWTLRRLITRARREGLLIELPHDTFRLTETGYTEARRLVREHRLWEMYLITHADVAPGLVDRSADRVEHVLGEPMVAELEALLHAEPRKPVPHSPHTLPTAGGGS